MGELVQSNAKNMSVNKERKEYMAQPRVKEFNKAMTNRLFNKRGRPPAFNSVEQLDGDIKSFLDLCEKTTTIPTVMGLATWLGVHKDTLYAHASNPNSIFSDSVKSFIDLCHLSLENGTIDGKVNPVTYIFMGKNYFGLSDSKDIKVSATTSQGSPNAEETASALRKQLEEESIPNATFSEEQ